METRQDVVRQFPTLPAQYQPWPGAWDWRDRARNLFLLCLFHGPRSSSKSLCLGDEVSVNMFGGIISLEVFVCRFCHFWICAFVEENVQDSWHYQAVFGTRKGCESPDHGAWDDWIHDANACGASVFDISPPMSIYSLVLGFPCSLHSFGECSLAGH